MRFIKRFTVKGLKIFTGLFLIYGILLVMGTPGASDRGIITFLQAVLQFIKGFSCIIIAWVLNFIKLVIE